MMSCTTSTAWSHLVSSPCYTERGQRCGAVLSGRITIVGMSRSGQLGLRCTVELNRSGMSMSRSLFDSHQGSIFSYMSPVIVAFLVSNFFDSHQDNIFSDMSPVIIAFLVSSLFSSRQGSLFSNMSSVIIVFTVIHQ
jgi:hypothetical protein